MERRFKSEKVPLYLGALLFGLGFIAASFIDRDTLLFTVLFFVCGTGVALMDSMTLPIATSWVLDKPGLAVGIARTGFGLSALFVAPFYEYLFKICGFNIGLRIAGALYLVGGLLVASLAKVNPSYRRLTVDGDVGRDLLYILKRRGF